MKKQSKTPADSLFVTRKIVAPDMLNPNGTLFGGVIMSWMDEVAFMSARRHAGVPNVVTASVDNISFLMPLRLGEHIVLTSAVNYVGRSSMEIGVKVEREDAFSGDLVHANTAYFTFVCLDKKGRPKSVLPLLPETEDDHRRYEEARLRVKIRSRLRSHLRKKLASRNNTSAPQLRPITSVAAAAFAQSKFYKYCPVSLRGYAEKMADKIMRLSPKLNSL